MVLEIQKALYICNINNVGDKDRPDMDLYWYVWTYLKMVWFFMIMDNISRCILLWGLYRRRKRSLLLLDEY